jgi:hypothetical protein
VNKLERELSNPATREDEMRVRSEREQRDYDTGHWQLLDEIMEAIRCEYQSPSEVIEALLGRVSRQRAMNA